MHVSRSVVPVVAWAGLALGACGGDTSPPASEEGGCTEGSVAISSFFSSTDEWLRVDEAVIIPTEESDLTHLQQELASEAQESRQVALRVDEGKQLAGVPASILLINEPDGRRALDALAEGDTVYAAVTPIRSYLLTVENGDVSWVDACQQALWHEQFEAFVGTVADTPSPEDVLLRLISDTDARGEPGVDGETLAQLEAFSEATGSPSTT